jgi:hypothetical protein
VFLAQSCLSDPQGFLVHCPRRTTALDGPRP